MLRRNQKVELIRGVPLFANLSKRELEEVASIADEIDFKEGKELIREGARGREFFVLLDGAVEVTQEGDQINQLGNLGAQLGAEALAQHRDDLPAQAGCILVRERSLR
jgi:signal-transduction protein with cAMP-binding, CBS, and nucleotidyltransferase domain